MKKNVLLFLLGIVLFFSMFSYSNSKLTIGNPVMTLEGTMECPNGDWVQGGRCKGIQMIPKKYDIMQGDIILMLIIIGGLLFILWKIRNSKKIENKNLN